MQRSQESLDRFKVSLTGAIQKWIDKQSESDPSGDWSSIGWTGDNLSPLMAASAMAVLECGLDTQIYLEREGELKNA